MLLILSSTLAVKMIEVSFLFLISLILLLSSVFVKDCTSSTSDATTTLATTVTDNLTGNAATTAAAQDVVVSVLSCRLAVTTTIDATLPLALVSGSYQLMYKKDLILLIILQRL